MAREQKFVNVFFTIIYKGVVFMKKIEKEYNTMFEKIKCYDENGTEYWFARELQLV